MMVKDCEACALRHWPVSQRSKNSTPDNCVSHRALLASHGQHLHFMEGLTCDRYTMGCMLCKLQLIIRVSGFLWVEE